jgi:phage regulator Rha-like protein
MAENIVATIQVQEIDGQLLVDSRLIAERLGIQHRVLTRTIDKYLTELQGFGNLRFENATSQPNVNGAVHQTKFVYLNEDQATLLMTMSRNTAQVIQCKVDLVTAFKQAKSIIRTVIPVQNDRIRELELENRELELKKELLQLKGSMVSLHGKELALRLMGDSSAMVTIETVVTEVVEPETRRSTKILSADQLKRAVKERTGQNLKSMKQFTDALHAAGRDDLLIPVNRTNTALYVPPDRLDEALGVVFGAQRQVLMGE